MNHLGNMIITPMGQTVKYEVPPEIQFHGRWDLDGPNRYITHWAGSSLCFQTTCRSITVEIGSLTVPRLNFHNILWRFGTKSLTKTALVKGRRSMKLTVSEAQGAGGEKPRDVTIMLCDWGAKLQILGISATDDAKEDEANDSRLLAPSLGTAPSPMLFIGDSLVSGFTPLYSGLVLPHGSYQTFGSIIVRTLRGKGLDARLEMVAYPGIRLVTTNQHSKGMEDVFWDGIDGAGGWDQRSKDNPEDIFICIGTNDRGWGIGSEEFIDHYKAFVRKLRDSYPEGLKRMHLIVRHIGRLLLL
ncbi:hypothetical protein M422DRAFT_49132 [Sphaerobolus stellatus SS14]|uniref:Unplaced genomic scaffold SPHSTscaffold_69, whole genome shotgun sequence n=1 Tax=Sphaerobolus stellatus (strain SS14) TaxID=990650 RepID=A0A0C9UZU9_SPHS4|nr:hypothetical protein M422DRAFT_49132 [Sphaerobolus stellatus SS14]